MPSQPALPVLHELAGWSPYQQHTSAAWVIESPIAAMLLGGFGVVVALLAVGTASAREKMERRTTRRRRMAAALPFAQAGSTAGRHLSRYPPVVTLTPRSP